MQFGAEKSAMASLLRSLQESGRRNPKPVSVFNSCRRCDSEIVGRAAVEALVLGRERVYVSPEVYGYRTYESGAAFLCAAGKNAGREVVGGFQYSYDETRFERFVRCKCEPSLGKFDPLVMVREPYKRIFEQKFGSRVNLPLLFSLPVQAVAWENCADVYVTKTEFGQELTDDGIALIDIVKDMSRFGVFAGTVERMSLDELIHGYTYLHMVKPVYRVFVAKDFGPTVDMSSFLSSVPMEWVDWEALPALKCVSDEETGEFVLDRAVGIPMVHSLYRFLADNKRAVARPEVHGTSLSTRGLWAQLVGPQVAEGDTCELQYVNLADGTAFLPSGKVVVSAEKKVLTFEPGISIVTASGAVLNALDDTISLFVDGVVWLDIHMRDCKDRVDCLCNVSPSELRSYAVAVKCESYARHTNLGVWYSRRLQAFSVDEAFVQARADLFLLSTARVDSRRKPWDLSSLWQVPREQGQVGVSEHKLQLETHETAHVRVGACILDFVRARMEGVALSVGGITPSHTTRLMVVGEVALSASLSSHWHSPVCDQSEWGRADSACEMSTDHDFAFRRTVFLEHGSDAGDKALTEVVSDGLKCGVLNASIRPLQMLQLFLPDTHQHQDSVFTFRVIALDVQSMVYHLGARPSLQALLGCPARFIDRGAIARTGLSFGKGEISVVSVDKAFMTWKEVLLYARSWDVGSSFGTLLSHVE